MDSDIDAILLLKLSICMKKGKGWMLVLLLVCLLSRSEQEQDGKRRMHSGNQELQAQCDQMGFRHDAIDARTQTGTLRSSAKVYAFVSTLYSCTMVKSAL